MCRHSGLFPQRVRSIGGTSRGKSFPRLTSITVCVVDRVNSNSCHVSLLEFQQKAPVLLCRTRGGTRTECLHAGPTSYRRKELSIGAPDPWEQIHSAAERSVPSDPSDPDSRQDVSAAPLPLTYLSRCDRHVLGKCYADRHADLAP